MVEHEENVDGATLRNYQVNPDVKPGLNICRGRLGRFAATRGFDNKGLDRFNKSRNYTPSASPTRFEPVAGSTPLASPDRIKSSNQTHNKLHGISSLYGTRSTSVTPAAGHTFPPRRPNLPTVAPPKPSATNFVRQSVITPVNTPESSLDWDHYLDTQRFTCSVEDNFVANPVEEDILDNFKITLVSTSVSSLSSDSAADMSRIPVPPSQMEAEVRNNLQREINQECKKLMDMYQLVLDLMEDYSVEDINLGNVDRVDGQLDRISEARSNFRAAVRIYREQYAQYGDSENTLDSHLISLNQKVREHANSIWSRVAEINPPMTQFEKETLALQKKQIEQQQLIQQQQSSQFVSQQTPRRVSIASERQEQGIRSCEGKRLLFRDELRLLVDSLSLPDYGSIDEFWREQSENDIRRAMRKISNWERSILSLSKAFREYETLSKQFVVDSEELEGDSTEYLETRNKVKEVICAVQSEDERRNLQTLESAKSDKVSYPTFSGETGEDLVRFKTKINECFMKNRVPESDQLDKLRENLKGAALKRVPFTVKKLSIAWQNLEEAFGSPLVVLRERLKGLTKLGGIPSDTVPSKQITWLLDLETVLQDILDLGDCDDMNMQMGAFGPSVQEQIIKAFHDNPLKKQELAITGSGKQPKEKIIAYRDKVIEFRRKTQLAEVESGSIHDKKTSKTSTSGSANLSYPGPKKNDGCRICLYLEAHNLRSNHSLFEKHLGTLPVHCPNFISMKMPERRKIAMKAKFCIYCLHPDIEFSSDHVKMCKEAKKKTKSSFSCVSPNCSCHFWLCNNHYEDNKNKLRDASKNLERHGLRLALHGTVVLTTTVAPEVRSALQSLESQVNKEMEPVPNGQPIFMFFGAKGKTRSLMSFFDNGCSRFIMRECIPGKELPASLVKRGPIPIGGVGGVTVYASGEYLVAMDTVEGKAQQLQGVTVPVITGDFPVLDISAAVSAVKADDKRNYKLRNCKFPRNVGGSVDLLIGIQYNQLQPKLVHMLPSGLAIYETKLTPFSKGMNFILGGPHASFDLMLARSGNAAFLLNEFVAGLTSWKNSGPPSLTNYFMSNVEIADAIDRNLKDGTISNYEKLIDDDESELQSILDASNSVCTDSEAFITTEMYEQVRNATCFDCGYPVVDDIALYEDEKLTRLKLILDRQEQGIEISYRCVRCRSCIDCKNSSKVDKISLREESELYEIRKSVFLDWENQKISCTLPVRGKEWDFLSCNEDRALKVLDAQCRKYFKDEETKASIVASFQKLIDMKYILFLDSMSANQLSQFQDKQVQYFLPWRIQFKPGSASTPARVVFDASSGTKKRQDGTGGRCLNDYVVKGTIDSLDLLRVVLRFLIGPFALAADLTKMYNQFSLLPGQWNLQRILFRKDLNPEAPVQHACVTTLIYGVKSVSGQTEYAFQEIANYVKDEKPKVSQLLTAGRYCDNLLDSTVTMQEAEDLAYDTTEVLNRLSLPTKGFSFSGQDPQPQESLDGISIDVNGMRWCTAVDTLEVKIPPLHFSKRLRGRVVGAEYFQDGGNFAEMNAFVPEKLTRRIIVSKRAALYDPLGKLEPVKAMLKIHEREAVLATQDWEDSVSADLRNKWVNNFLIMEQLKGIRFSRARMPSTAIDTRMRLITLVDGAKDLVMVGCWCGFRVSEGGWSNQHLIGRSALGQGTIPKNELQALIGGSNLSWIVRKALPDWIDDHILAGDSEIALHWTISDTRKLGEWHRNRVIQIRRGTELCKLYYVSSENNVADVGTKADRVRLEDVGPESRYENGDKWMKMEIDDAVKSGILRPATDLKAGEVEGQEDFQKGLIFEKEPEVLTRGHTAHDEADVSRKRLNRIEARAVFSNYGKLLPTRRSFPSMVRITAYVVAFITKCRIKANKKVNRSIIWSGDLLCESSLRFSAFPSTNPTTESQISPWVSVENSQYDPEDLLNSFSAEITPVGLAFYLETHAMKADMNLPALPTSRYLNAALTLYFRIASREVLEFNSKVVVEKRAVMKDGILLSRGRLIQGMNFLETAELNSFNLGSVCIKTQIPVIDRFSPLAYSIAQYIHYNVAKHKGMESCHRISLHHVNILQGMSLYREINEDCIKCKIKRGKFIQASLGPLSEKQLIVAPPFYAVQIDLCGPCRVFVPGFERETRASKIKESKVWIMVAVCLVTSNVNIQVCEMKDTSSMLEALIRLSCESGYPKYICCDKESSILAMLREIKVNLRDLHHRMYREHGAIVEECAVGGHDQHGKVERMIRSVQDSLEDLGLSRMRIHSMGLQTMCKQIENSLNNLPLGYRFQRDQDNTETLQILVPNMLKIGRINSRAMDGPVKLSSDNRKMLSDIQQKFEAWYKIWCDIYVPKLMVQKKNFKNDRDLEQNDLVYYKKKEGELSGRWVIGRVEQVVRGRDGIIRRAIIKYQNASEEVKRETERSVRTLIKLYSVDDPDLQ